MWVPWAAAVLAAVPVVNAGSSEAKKQWLNTAGVLGEWTCTEHRPHILRAVFLEIVEVACITDKAKKPM